jgi:cysteinyl-tRNA synthetase
MVTIRLTNSKTRRKEDFVPIDPANVRMYVCGPTVYDRAHLGNARPVVVFDTLYRLLRHVYGPDHVTYVRNFTDVDDKINAEALRRQRSAGAPGTLEDADPRADRRDHRLVPRRHGRAWRAAARS